MGATAWGKSAQGIDFEPNPSTPHQAGTSPLECWYSGAVNQTAYSTVVINAGFIRGYPVVIGRSGYIDRLAFEVTSTVANAVARNAIYKATSQRNLYPGELIVDGGEKDSSTPGVKSSTISVFLSAGLYWFVCLNGTANPTVRGIGPGSQSPVIGIPTTMGASNNQRISVAFAYAAYPSTFPAGATLAADSGPVGLTHIRWST